MVKQCFYAFILFIVLKHCFTFSTRDVKNRKHCQQNIDYQGNREAQRRVHGCKVGWYGPLCNKRCHRLCRFSLCDQYDGRCTVGCKRSLTKQIGCKGRVRKLIKRSIQNCIAKDPENEERCVCCKQNYRGDKCEQICENCRTYNRSSICRYFCEGGYYGNTCQSKCSRRCEHGQSGTPICAGETSGKFKCIGCVTGYFGQQCTNTCSTRCINRTCHQEDGHCVSCPNMFHGHGCNLPCSNQCLKRKCYLNGTCVDRCPINCISEDALSSSCTGTTTSDALCTLGCKDGFYGSKCNDRCIRNCRVCDQKTGECLNCTEALYGENCNKTCIKNCKLCHKKSGACEVCKKSLYGEMCNETCSPGCDGKTCYRNGTCDQCISGYYGTFCKKHCGKNCLNSNCETDTVEHNHSYMCTEGCKDGYIGRQCMSENHASVPLAVGVTIIIMTILVLIVIVFLICRLTRIRNRIQCQGGAGCHEWLCRIVRCRTEEARRKNQYPEEREAGEKESFIKNNGDDAETVTEEARRKNQYPEEREAREKRFIKTNGDDAETVTEKARRKIQYPEEREAGEEESFKKTPGKDADAATDKERVRSDQPTQGTSSDAATDKERVRSDQPTQGTSSACGVKMPGRDELMKAHEVIDEDGRQDCINPKGTPSVIRQVVRN